MLFQGPVARFYLGIKVGRLSRGREEIFNSLRAGLLGMQGQRCPVGVTEAPELRPPDTEPCQQGRCRPNRGLDLGGGGVLVENFSST